MKKHEKTPSIRSFEAALPALVHPPLGRWQSLTPATGECEALHREVQDIKHEGHLRQGYVKIGYRLYRIYPPINWHRPWQSSGLEDWFPLKMAYFQGRTVNLAEGNSSPEIRPPTGIPDFRSLCTMNQERRRKKQGNLTRRIGIFLAQENNRIQPRTMEIQLQTHLASYPT